MNRPTLGARRVCLALVPLLSSSFIAGCAGAPAASVPAPVAQVAFDPAARVDSALVRFVTTKGEIDVMLRTAWAPHGTARVREAVGANYYDGARFFRALRGFVVQFGIAADSTTSAAWRTRSIPDDTVRQTNRRGTLVFAAGGPNTRTTQLFFNLRDNARLDAMGFAPLGEIVRGLDVLDALHIDYALVPGGATPDQGKISNEGEAYLAREFPLLDKIHTARIVRTFPAGK